MLQCELPKMELVPKGKDRFLDVDKYAQDVADNLRSMGADLTVKKASFFDKLFRKNK